ncbi:MAG TPA: response regulator [Iamia sp.]
MAEAAPPPRVVLAEDDDNLRALLVAALRHFGWEVMPARDGREAIDLTASIQPDVVLLDVNMPVHDGFEVCRRLRAAGVSVPIVFLSASTSEEQRRRATEAGADDYLAKPLPLDDLAEVLDGLVSRDGRPAP